MTVTIETFPRAFAIRFKELERWDPVSFERITWHWSKELMAPIGAVLKARKEKVDRSRFAFSDLQPITIHFDGSLDRRNVDGDREYTMELFFARPGDIIVAKIDLKNGAVGIVPADWRNVVVTGHFAVYEPDRSRLLPEYLHRIIQTSFFKALLWRNKVGAEGRKEVKLDFFESLQIPLPPLPIQQAIVERWEKAQMEISEVWGRIDRLENEIPFLVYKELGVLPPALNGPTAKYLVQCWKDLERWSFNYQARARQRLFGFANSKFSIISLRQCLIDTMNGYCIKPVARPTPYKMLKLSALTPAGLDLTESKFINVSNPDYSQPQKSTTESACDVRITPAQSHHRISGLLKQAHQVVLALHQSVALLPTSTRQHHSPLGLPTSTWHLSRRRSRWRSQSLRGEPYRCQQG